MFGLGEFVRVYGLRERVARAILTEGGFDMNYWRKEDSKCGTACCIAGHIVNEAYPKQPFAFFSIQYLARSAWRAVYGDVEANRLRFSSAWGDNLVDTTAQEAIAHLYGAPAVRHD